MFCRKCGKEIFDDSIFCSYCGAATEKTASENGESDVYNVGICILCFFIPLLGLILWLKNKNTKRSCAKSAGLGAIIGIGVMAPFLIWILDAFLASILKLLI